MDSTHEPAAAVSGVGANKEHLGKHQVSAAKAEPLKVGYVIIKAGKFVGHLARISSFTNNRYNMQILTDSGTANRKEDGTTRSTALVSSGFEYLNVDLPKIEAGPVGLEDLPLVVAELNRKRSELKITVSSSHSLNNGRSSAPNSALASTLVGSPSHKSKLKGKPVPDEEVLQSFGDGEESRNNLYWVDIRSVRGEANAAKCGFVCLWYGGATVKSSDVIQVLPISPKIEVRSDPFAQGAGTSISYPIVPPRGLNGSIIAEEATDESDKASSTSLAALNPLDGLVIKIPDDADVVEDNLMDDSAVVGGVEESDCDSDGGAMDLLEVPHECLRKVRRSDLSPLDEDLVHAKYAHAPEDHPYRHFLLALLAFAEWDYPHRDSYLWPDFAVALMKNRFAQGLYLQQAKRHPLNNGSRPLSDVILFLLCGEHTGVLEEWCDELYAERGQCTDAIQSLLESISDFKRTNEEVYRATCRAGSCYQSEHLPSLQSALDPSVDPLAEPLLFSGAQANDAVVEEYLSQVHCLREALLKVNQVVEAPLNVHFFAKEWDAFLATRKSRNCMNKYAIRNTMNEFISSSRRQNKKLTALYTVKQPPAQSVVGEQGACSSGISQRAGQVTAPASDSTDEVVRLMTPTQNGDAQVNSSSASVLPNSAEASSKSPAEWIIVHAGAAELKMPLSFCRIFILPDDVALEILHSCQYDTARALRVVTDTLRAGTSTGTGTGTGITRAFPTSTSLKSGAPTEAAQETHISRIFCKNREIAISRCLISTWELDMFHSTVNKYQNDLRKIFTKFNRQLTKQALRNKAFSAHISSVDRSAGPYFFPDSGGVALSDAPAEGAEFAPRSMQEVQAMFFLFYPGLDDDPIPLLTAFNSPLFRVFNNSTANGLASGPGLNNEVASTRPGGAGLSNKKAPQRSTNGGGNSGSGSRRSAAVQSLLAPNRWPSVLPAIQHNLYWLSTSNAPCLCTGIYLKPKSNEVQLQIIIINSESHRMTVMPNKLVPLHDELMKRSNDERAVAFASALMEFAEWELENYVPATSLLRKWYVYPEFITQMLILTSRWLGWRKQADRNARAATMSRRDNYLIALMEDYKAIPEDRRNERYSVESLPWDDSPVLEADAGESSDEEGGEEDPDSTSGIESYSEREDSEGEDEEEEDGTNSKLGSGSKKEKSLKRSSSSSGLDNVSNEEEMDLFTDQPSLSSSKKRSRLSDANSKNGRSRNSLSTDADTEDAGSEPPALRSLYNMFWIPRSQLPCLYYDLPENRYKDKFKIIPICCLTYHYPFVVNANTKGSIEPLQMHHLKLVSDERTAEFAFALIEFARKENERKRKVKMEMASEGDFILGGSIGGEIESFDDSNDMNSLHDASMLQPNELFDWPQFITELVNQPTLWHSWRKKAERSRTGLKRHQYLRALQISQDEYEEKEKLARIAQEQALATREAKEVLVNNASATPLPIPSLFNLFWLLRSNLPAIYYDSPENRKSDKFLVLPINCCQYQYPMQVARSAVVIEALSLSNLSRCSEDRTHEFTLALLDFARWELNNRRAQVHSSGKELYFVSDESDESPVATDSSPPEVDPQLYDWPDFILQMLNSPDQWSIWRKKAERSSSREGKRVVYFRALVEDYGRLLAAAAENPAIVSA